MTDPRLKNAVVVAKSGDHRISDRIQLPGFHMIGKRKVISWRFTCTCGWSGSGLTNVFGAEREFYIHRIQEAQHEGKDGG